jgi:hypothetical protein
MPRADSTTGCLADPPLRISRQECYLTDPPSEARFQMASQRIGCAALLLALCCVVVASADELSSGQSTISVLVGGFSGTTFHPSIMLRLIHDVGVTHASHSSHCMPACLSLPGTTSSRAHPIRRDDGIFLNGCTYLNELRHRENAHQQSPACPQLVQPVT